MKTEPIVFTGLLVAKFLIGLMIGFAVAEIRMEKRFHAEAVQRGHATWKVNADGTTEFQWEGEAKE